ncbi:MAG: 2-hydroxyhepta-2,4-diene-1,7-dioate isomerase [Betaproteobacteria bacterium RIFCSPLOWO2_12_FULL_63_13]|nr:MAG: 2-hydroxyhepta-2,4-diene-1,7-dioate isomerase [Betaproteobacteria bacterium RIFCSPLOWO2_12_FULL_63_13]
MQICRYDSDRLGVVQNDHVYDVTEVREEVMQAVPWHGLGDPVIARLPQLIARIRDVLAQRSPIPLAAVKLRSPVRSPTKLVAAPTNYRTHIAEMQAVTRGMPVQRSNDIGTAGMFLKANSSMVGPSEGVGLRFLDRRNDHEVELALVIGKVCNQVSMERALDYVAGYCIGLDITLRGPEDRSFRKSIDSYSVLGPWLVTADEIPDPDNLQLKLAVNNELRQNANTRDMVYSVRRLIEFSSTFYTLHPGDVLFTGTPEGVSPIKPGDTLSAEIEKVGRMVVAVRGS